MTPEGFQCPESPACGITRTSPDAKKIVKYSFWGMVAMGLVGISATPKEVYYVCRKCKKKFDILDPEERKKAH